MLFVCIWCQQPSRPSKATCLHCLHGISKHIVQRCKGAENSHDCSRSCEFTTDNPMPYSSLGSTICGKCRLFQSTPPQTPSTSTKNGRYPASLSRVAGVGSPHRRGTSKHYETLEDLLTAAGYKETRVITPIRTRKSSNSSAVESSDADALPADNEGLGRRFSNFLSSWMPGASVSVGRARGAEIAREGRRRTIGQEAQSTDVDEAEGSAHVSLLSSRSRAGNRNIPSAGLSQSRPRMNRNATTPRVSLPTDFTTSRDAMTFPAPAPRIPPAFSNPEILPDITTGDSSQVDITPRLRHAVTSPNLKRPLLLNKRSLTTRHIVRLDSGEGEAMRGRTLTVRDENAATDNLAVPGRSRKRKSGSRSRSRPSNPRTTFTPASTLTPVLKTEEVVCRSTPHSRSASRVRGSQRHPTNEGIPPVPPLLSPAIMEDRLNAWLQDGGRVERPRSYASQSTTLDHTDDRGNDDDDPGLGHIVFSRLSASIGTGSDSRSSSESLRPKDGTNLSPSAVAALHSQSHIDPTGSEPVRRQQSIQSLRAHLAPRKQRAHFLSNTVYLGRVGVPLSGRASPSRRDEASGWLDGPEWRGAVHQPTHRNSQRTGKRGLIPWFGGERVFLERDAGNLSLDQDE